MPTLAVFHLYRGVRSLYTFSEAKSNKQTRF